jgi:hypothetical protein
MLGLGTAAELKIGERYVRADGPDTVWTVEQVVELPRLPLHAQIVSDGILRRRVLVSSAALRDRRQYRQLKDGFDDLRRPAPPRARGWRSLFGW